MLYNESSTPYLKKGAKDFIVAKTFVNVNFTYENTSGRRQEVSSRKSKTKP